MPISHLITRFWVWRLRGIKTRSCAEVAARGGLFYHVGKPDGAVAATRSAMIGILDGFRDNLEDLRGGLGVTTRCRAR